VAQLPFHPLENDAFWQEGLFSFTLQLSRLDAGPETKYADDSLTSLMAVITVATLNFVCGLSMANSNVVKPLRQMVLAYQFLRYRCDVESISTASVLFHTLVV
jgi:hypothetical protein